jgi:membrane-associated protein
VTLLRSLPVAAQLSTTWWQYTVVFLAVTASWAGVPIIGASAAAAAGIAASQGRLDIALTVVVIAIAGEVGGIGGYHVGSRWGRQLVERPGKHQSYRQNLLAKGERAYERWGRVAVFFTPSIVSGTAHMQYNQFVVWNFFDALGFALFTIGAAYGAGRILSGHHALRDIAILVGFVGIGTFLLVIVRRHHERNTPERGDDS